MKLLNKIITFLAKIPSDKLLHLLVNLIGAGILFGLSKLIIENQYLAMIVPGSVMLVIDIWKELWHDKRERLGSPEWSDFLYDIVGLILGLGIGLLN